MNTAPTPRPAPFDPAFFAGRRVLVTGHTGFRGAWLCQWLLQLGADVTGCALQPKNRPNLFEVLGLQERMDHRELDIGDRDELAELIEEVRPEIVFHLADRSDARESPLRTLETNVLGTANLLAALADAGYDAEEPCAVVCASSDHLAASDSAQRGGDPGDGDDLYRASKDMVERLCRSWRRSFFTASEGRAPVRLATARTGDLIGGGDWAQDRIVPDAIRALGERRTIEVRRADAGRPWQHVLEALGGLLDLAQALLSSQDGFETAWNFGPGAQGERSVATLCNQLVGAWGGGGWQAVAPPNRRPPATCLRLDTNSAAPDLAWQPTWSFEESVRRTVAWYRAGIARRHEPAAMIEWTRDQIETFQAARASRAGAQGNAVDRTGPLAHAS